MSAASISPRSTACPKHVLEQGFPLIEELVLHDVVECGVARYLNEHGPHGAGVRAYLLADRLPHLQQIAAQRAGLRSNGDLADAFDECRQHQFGFRRPPPVHSGLAGSRGGGHRIDRQPVITFLL